jgi:hypothetical protein
MLNKYLGKLRMKISEEKSLIFQVVTERYLVYQKPRNRIEEKDYTIC